MMHEKLFKNVDAYKHTLSYLWDDVLGTIWYMQQIQLYKKDLHIFNWLVVNELRGQKLIDFFKNETDRERGVLVGITFIINKLEGHKLGPLRSLHVTDLKV